MISALTLPARRHAKWWIVAAWLVAMVVTFGLDLPTKFSDAEKNDSSSFLPGDAESTRALEASEKLTNGEVAPMVVVYRRAGGLTEADSAKIAADRERFNQRREQLAARPDPALAGPFKATTPLDEPIFSPDGSGAILTAQITANGESETILEPVQEARDLLSDPGGGLEAKVTGGAGFSADAIEVFEQINGTLIGAAFLLVLVLLALIYRSPFFLWIPLVVVGFAELATRRHRLRPDRGRHDGQWAVLLDPLRAGARRRYRLRAAAGRALPGGAAPPRGPVRGDASGAPHRRAGGVRLRADGHPRAARPEPGRRELHGGARADRRGRDRHRDGGDADAAAGDPADRRAEAVLAARPALRRRGRRRDARRLATRRRARRALAAARVARDQNRDAARPGRHRRRHHVGRHRCSPAPSRCWPCCRSCSSPRSAS